MVKHNESGVGYVVVAYTLDPIVCL